MVGRAAPADGAIATTNTTTNVASETRLGLGGAAGHGAQTPEQRACLGLEEGLEAERLGHGRILLPKRLSYEPERFVHLRDESA